jgi:peroxiredoxin-like protein
MTPIQQPLRKTDTHHLFEVQLNWLHQQTGIISAHDTDSTIHVATPPAFGGEGRHWSPEHLLLGAVNSCFMSTLLVFVKKMNIELSRFECSSIGRVDLEDGKYRFTRIDVYPKIFTTATGDLEKAKKALEKTQQYCLVSNSLNAECIYHGEVLTDPFPRFTAQQNDVRDYDDEEM